MLKHSPDDGQPSGFPSSLSCITLTGYGLTKLKKILVTKISQEQLNEARLSRARQQKSLTRQKTEGQKPEQETGHRGIHHFPNKQERSADQSTTPGFPSQAITNPSTEDKIPNNTQPSLGIFIQPVTIDRFSINCQTGGWLNQAFSLHNLRRVRQNGSRHSDDAD